MKLSSTEVVDLLERVLLHVADEVVVVLDRAIIRRSKPVQAFVLIHERLSLVYLPPYAPELNPIQSIQAELKRNVGENFCGASVEVLKKRLTFGQLRIRCKDYHSNSKGRHPSLRRDLLKQISVDYTLTPRNGFGFSSVERNMMP